MARKRLLSPAVLLLALSLPNRIHGAEKAESGPGPEVVEPDAVTVAAHAQNSALMGKMFPLVSRLFARQEGLSFRHVAGAVADLVDRRELAIFASIGWGLVPVTKSIYDTYSSVVGKGNSCDGEGAGVAVEGTKKSRIREAYDDTMPWDDKKSNDRRQEIGSKPHSEVFREREKSNIFKFEDSLLFQVVNHISQASKIGLSVIVVDCMSLISRMMGYNPWNIMDSASRIFSKVVYTGWITFRIKLFKRHLIEKALGVFGQESDLGKLKFVDSLADGVLFLIWVFHILNYLEVYSGMALKSLFGVGATGTLVFGLASKDIASQIISGIILGLSDKIYEGDDVRFADGTSGKIEKMGWFETMVRNSDELMVGIPNAQLSGQRMYNLSRTPRSQVRQVLRISYDDAARIPKLLESIKDTIRRDCPELIADGSRPFRAHWRNYEDDHLEVVVDCHFAIRPVGDEYWDNRQRVLEAIHRAAQETGVRFERLVRTGGVLA